MQDRALRTRGYGYLIGYVATIIVANWFVQHYGAVPVGFGLVAPAGVYAAGAAFTLRDLAQEALGRTWTLIGIAAGTALAFLVADGRLAVASGLAFAASELADFAVYTPLRRRSWLGAVIASNTVGVVVDSWLFLTIAFGSRQYLAGQVVGKMWVTAVSVAILACLRAGLRRRVVA